MHIEVHQEIVNCLFCSKPIRLGHTWLETEDKIHTIRQHKLEPYSQHLIGTSGKLVQAFIPHICKK